MRSPDPHRSLPGGGIIKHGHTWEGGKSPTYYSWRSMKRRCNDAERKHYGGKGIAYDPRWESFEVFLADMGERPIGKTLERLDNNKGYSKGNCEWATPVTQTRNRSVTIQVSVNGETLPLAAWSERLGIGWKALYQRYKRGTWPA